MAAAWNLDEQKNSDEKTELDLSRQLATQRACLGAFLRRTLSLFLGPRSGSAEIFTRTVRGLIPALIDLNAL